MTAQRLSEGLGVPSAFARLLDRDSWRASCLLVLKTLCAGGLPGTDRLNVIHPLPNAASDTPQTWAAPLRTTAGLPRRANPNRAS